MNVNEHQVGGDHYRSEYQHWDLVINISLPYLEAQAVRYISRWRKKGGIQDVEKANHFIQKLRSVQEIVFPYRSSAKVPLSMIVIEVGKYVSTNNLPLPEALISRYLACWETDEELAEAERLAKALLEQAKVEFSAKPSEENKHAFQYDDRSEQ